MNDEDYYEEELDYDDESEREVALKVSYMLTKKNPQPVPVPRWVNEFPISQLGVKTDYQKWLIMTSRMNQKTVNYAIACARSRLPMDSRLEHLRCILNKMLPQAEEKPKVVEKNAVYVVGDTVYEARMTDDGLWFSGLIHVTTAYEVVTREVVVDTTCTLALDVSACPHREVRSSKGYFGDIKMRDITKSREILETGMTRREKEIISCWFDDHVLTSVGFTTTTYEVTDKEYLAVMKGKFGMRMPATPWYINVPKFITDDVVITTDCGCACHVGREDFHVEGQCDWCMGGEARVAATVLSESYEVKDTVLPVTVFEHMAGHSTLKYDTEIKLGHVTKVEALLTLEIEAQVEGVKVSVKDGSGVLIHEQMQSMSGWVSSMQVEVFNERTMPHLPIHWQVNWMDYVLIIGEKVRSPLPFRPPYITEALEYEGYDSNCFVMVVGRKLIAISKTWEEEIPLGEASGQLLSMAMNCAVGIMMRDTGAVVALIGSELFDHFLMASKWCLTGFYYADLIFNGLYKVSRLSPQWGIVYRNAMIPVVSRFSVPQWLYEILLMTQMPNEIIDLMIKTIEAYPVDVVELHDQFDVTPLDESPCFKYQRLTERMRKDFYEFRYRGASRRVSVKDYDKMLFDLFLPSRNGEHLTTIYEKRLKSGTMQNELIQLSQSGYKIVVADKAGVVEADVEADLDEHLYMAVGD